MLTQQAMGWNKKKTANLHKVLANRYIKVRTFFYVPLARHNIHFNNKQRSWSLAICNKLIHTLISKL